MANHATLTSLFSDIAKAIRSKTGGTASIVADNFPDAIDSIVTLSGGSSDATATAGEILSGKTAYVNGVKVTGSMANQGAVSQAINAGGSYTIPAGYHNGSGKVTGNSLASQTSATAAAGNIQSGYTAWVNGSKVTGTAAVASDDGNWFNFEENKALDFSGFAYVDVADGSLTSLTAGSTYIVLSNGGSRIEIRNSTSAYATPIIEGFEPIMFTVPSGARWYIISGVYYRK